jgi:hypothetical protein
MKTIDIDAKEWFDKINGNSYFSGQIIIDYAMKTERRYDMPFQYGYGDHYVDVANQLLMEKKEIPHNRYDNGMHHPLWMYCKENKIILRNHKQQNCLKKELKQCLD